MSDLFGLAGSQLLARIDLPPAMRAKVSNCLQLIDLLSFQIEYFDKLARNRLRDAPGFKAVCTIPGIGGVLGAIFVAAIGDVHRFRRAEQLSSWVGLTPRHRESDTTVHRGRITKRGS